MKNLAYLVFLAAPLGACSPYSPDLGAAPFLCGSADPKCTDGYSCMPNGSGSPVCVDSSGKIPDAHTDCADDSALEPNNDYHHAFATGVADQKKSIPYAGLAICPAGDVDDYSIQITAEGQNLELVAVFDPNGATLSMSILNAGGVSIASASPVTGMQGTIRAYTANLPTGTYYAEVKGPTSGTLLTNNYKLTITVTP